MSELADLVIVELGGSVAGAYCGKLFADAGADVTVIGPDTMGPHQRAYLQRGKRVADTFDFTRADVIIESSAPEPLVPQDFDAPQAVHVQISPFGCTGPRSHWRGTDLTDYAVGGHLYLYGDPNREPLIGPANQSAYASGLFAFVGAMSALLARDRLGSGQVVEISQVESMVALHQFTFIRYLMSGDVIKRMGNRFTGQGQPNGLYPCADGWVAIAAPAPHQVEMVLAATGLTDMLGHPCIESPLDFQNHPEPLDKALCAWLADKTQLEVVELFQALRIPTGPALTMLELLEDPQLLDRECWESSDGSLHPRSPLRVTKRRVDESGGHRQWTPGDLADGPLAGLRVLDLTRVWAGPLATRVLADLGADVVWIEAPWSRGPKELPESMVRATRYFPDDDPGKCQWNRNTHLVKYALGKQSLVLDLDTDEGRAAIERLIPQFDIVIENYSTRVMPQLGLSEERLHELNPNLMYVTMPGFGRSGPAEHWVAYGSSVDSHAGLSSLMGYPEQTPWKGGVAWPDPIAGLHAASAMLIQLWQGQSNPEGGGATIELAQIEATIAVLGDRIVEAQANGNPVPAGNRDSRYIAQGVYPCMGDDVWIAVSVVDQPEWAALCKLAGLAGDAVDPAPGDLDHDKFDREFALWTARLEVAELVESLQAIGVAAGGVSNAAQVLADPHLKARGTFVELDQPEVGRFVATPMPVGLSVTPASVRGPAPLLGEHNADVLAVHGGFTTEQVAALVAAGVTATEPPD